MSNKKQITTVTAMALAFAKADPKVLSKLPEKALNNLEKSLTNAAKSVATSLPSKAKQDETVKAIELTVSTVATESGGELHVKTPYWAPFIYKCNELISKDAQRFDKATSTRIVAASERKTLLKVLRESFEKAKRPVYLTVDGKREQITAGVQA